MMSWNYHYPQAIIFSTTTPQGNNNVSLVHTHSLVLIPWNFTYGTSLPPPPNGQSFPASVTPTGNYMPWNNPPETVPHAPIGPDSDPSLSDTSSLDSSNSDYGYYKWGKHKPKRRWNKMRINYPIKKCAKITASISKYA